MSSEIKSGADTLQQFFADLEKDESINNDTSAILIKLFSDGKLTSRNIANALREQREEGLNDKD